MSCPIVGCGLMKGFSFAFDRESSASDDSMWSAAVDFGQVGLASVVGQPRTITRYVL